MWGCYTKRENEDLNVQQNPPRVNWKWQQCHEQNRLDSIKYKQMLYQSKEIMRTKPHNSSGICYKRNIRLRWFWFHKKSDNVELQISQPILLIPKYKKSRKSIALEQSISKPMDTHEKHMGPLQLIHKNKYTWNKKKIVIICSKVIFLDSNNTFYTFLEVIQNIQWHHDGLWRLNS